MDEELVRMHTVHGGPWMTSTGLVTNYIDGIGLLLHDPLLTFRYFADRLFLRTDNPLLPVGMGRSGAVVLGILGGGILYAGDKEYGLNWYGYVRPFVRRVALVDDVCFTGTTLDRLREACEYEGFEVVKEIVAWPVMAIEQVRAERQA